MPKRKKAAKRPQKALDTFSVKRGRGRPGVRRSEISGRGSNYRLIFSQIWKTLGDALLKAKTEEEVLRAFDLTPGYKREFAPSASLILQVLNDPKFPRRPEPQRNFLADSLAGLGQISPRRSRDICLQEQKKELHYIIRQDYYIECTCRYKGPALHGRCPKCGTDTLSLPFPPSVSGPRAV
jgi:hypothetical protein